MAAKISSKIKSAFRTIVSNRRAFRDYEILDTIEAGLVLTGTEIKSIRAGRANLQYSFARIDKGEVWLYNSHIAQYDQGNIYNHDPARPRKLLLHHRQILHLGSETGQKGLTLIPLRWPLLWGYSMTGNLSRPVGRLTESKWQSCVTGSVA